MANRIPVKAIFSGSDVTSLGEFTSSDTITASYISGLTGEVTGTGGATVVADNIIDEANLKISNSPTNGYVLTAQSGASGGMTWSLDAATDSTKMPLSGGTFTGNVTHSSGYLDMAGGVVYVNDSGSVRFGTSEDLKIFHDHPNQQNKIISGSLPVILAGTSVSLNNGVNNENMLVATQNAGVAVYHNHVKKFETTAAGATVTGNIAVTGTVDGRDVAADGVLATNALPKAGGTMTGTLAAASVTVAGNAVGTMTTDNDGSFAMSASNNFKCTPSGNFTLTFTSIVAQSGNILLINSGGHTVSAHANTKVDAKFLATISTAGTYLLAYFSDGTNVYMTNSAVYT